jgi:autotransporter-associated beta strand protein
LILLVPLSGVAQTWTGSISTQWNLAGNWSGGVPGAAAIATFNANTANDPNLTAAASVGRLFFDTGSDEEIFTGANLTIASISGLGIDNQSGVTQTFNNTLVIANAQTWNTDNGNLVFAAVTHGATNLTLTGNGGFDFSGILTNSGGNRTLTNDSTGTVNFSGGINLSNNNTGRTLTFTGSGDTLVSGIIANGGTTAGNLVKTGPGTLTLANTNTYTGTTTVGTAGGASGGTLRLGAAGAISTNTTTIFAGQLDLDGHNQTIGALTLGGGASGTTALVSTGGGTLTLGGNVTYTATNNPNGAVISGQLGLGAANRTFTINNSTAADPDLTVDAVISGSGGLIKAGTGTLALTAANTYSGGTTLSAGVLTVSDDQALGTGTLTLNTGTLQSTAANTVANTATLGGNVTLQDIDLSGTFTQSGGNRILTLNNANLSGTLNLSNNNTGRTLTTAIASGTTTFSGVIQNGGTGAGGLTKTLGGTLVLSNANTYTGATTVSGDTLIVQHDSALGSTAGSTTVASGATLQLDGSRTIGAEGLTISGAGVGGGGALRHTSGTSSWAGNITLAAASTITADAGLLTLAGSLTGANGRNLTFAGDGDITLTGTLSNGSSSLFKLGNGILTVGGTATYTGTTNLGTSGGNSTGTIRLAAADVIPAGAFNLFSGTFDLNGFNDTIGAINLGGGGAGSTAAVTTGSRTLTLGGNLAYIATNNPDGATISGNLNLGGANRTFTINDSTAAATDLTISANIGATNRNLTITGAGNTLISGNIATGTGTLVKQGAGTLTLTGANTYGGITTISAGTLNIQHSSALGGTGAGTTVASGATLAIEGNINVGNEAMTLSGTGVGGLGALRNISGTSSWAGNITLAAASTIAAEAGSLTFSGNLTGANSRNLTFIGAGDITVNGAISNGTSALLKDGSGTLTLSGSSANVYSGGTSIADGTLRLGKTAGLNALGTGAVTVGNDVGPASSAHLVLLAENQIADNTTVTLNSDGRFDLNGFAEAINIIGGTGIIDLGSGGHLTVGTNNGSSAFGGSITGTGDFTKQGTGTFTLNSDLNLAGTFTLAGGTLALNGNDLVADTLHITANSIIDFGSAVASLLSVVNFIIDGGVSLTIANWSDAVDYFVTQNWAGAVYDLRGAAPMNQITFNGFAGSDTQWQEYDLQITPVPEPSTYGALMLGLCATLYLWRRRRTKNQATPTRPVPAGGNDPDQAGE